MRKKIIKIIATVHRLNSDRREIKITNGYNMNIIMLGWNQPTSNESKWKFNKIKFAIENNNNS